MRQEGCVAAMLLSLMFWIVIMVALILVTGS